MISKIIRFIFFGNYFVGILAVALTLEATIQLRLPFNSVNYFLLLFLAPTIYYTYAYSKVSTQPSTTNPRTQWYYEHQKMIGLSQVVLSVVCAMLGVSLLYHNFYHILNLPLLYWIAIAVIFIAAVLYYGLLPRSFLNINLRNTGWFKAFVIGFVWACCANVLPLIMLKIETGINYHDSVLWTWLFIKNWMFCTVNAIIFDIKDYPTDANKHLRTFVVRYGLRKTIFNILIPLLIIGLVSLGVFASYKGFGVPQVLCNVLPFVATIYIAYSMHKRQNILYYLMVIDGLILFKAVCGIIGMQFVQ
ncbi:UbiA family prenyltransferase [Pedobacter frigidisoli]|uniref:UbiA family prenyltransferase n=1 Tax=Pedobacter frigidisoli TaxID=2530455 RepID=UPI0029303A6F|nr:UbiA family prenyltransferase [Pedobacter frigidisoli]